MASTQAKKGYRNRKPDNRYVPVDQRYRLNDIRYKMAMETGKVQHGFKWTMTPSMNMVVPGREFKLGGKSKLWNRNSRNPAVIYRALLSHFADHLLQPGGKQGLQCEELHKQASKKGKSYLWFCYPQVTQHSSNISCDQCHMPGRKGFEHHSFPGGNNPYKILHDPIRKTWYTMVNLGKDKNHKDVWEGAHCILAAARYGIPDSVTDPSLGDNLTHHALHGPCCPHCDGGCLNPLHIRWGLEAENHQDAEVKKSNMNRGKHAWNRKKAWT